MNQGQQILLIKNKICPILLAIYFLTPTSVPFIFDGLPFATKHECFLLYIVLVAWLTKVFIHHLLKLHLLPNTLRKNTQSQRHILFTSILVVLSIGLIAVKLFAPAPRGVPVCFQSPEVSQQGCFFSTEGIYVSNLDVSKNVDGIRFNKKHPWRLGFLNTLDFNVYGSESGTADFNAEKLRKRDASPFSATFTLGPEFLRLFGRSIPSASDLRFVVKYRGRVDALRGGASVSENIGAYSARMRKTEVTIRPTDESEIFLRFSNYTCLTHNNNTVWPDCAGNTSITTIPRNKATFEVYIHGRDKKIIPLTLGAAIRDFSITKTETYYFLFEFILLGLIAIGVLGRVVITVFGVADGSFRLSIREWIKRVSLLLRPDRWHCLIRSVVAYRTNPLFPSVVIIAITMFVLGWNLYVRYLGGEWWHRLFFCIIHYLPLIILVMLSDKYRNYLRCNKGRTIYYYIAIFAAIPFCFLFYQTVTQLGHEDNIILFHPGDDFLTYSSWAKDVLREGSLVMEPSIVLSKPLFIYLL